MLDFGGFYWDRHGIFGNPIALEAYGRVGSSSLSLQSRIQDYLFLILQKNWELDLCTELGFIAIVSPNLQCKKKYPPYGDTGEVNSLIFMEHFQTFLWK